MVGPFNIRSSFKSDMKEAQNESSYKLNILIGEWIAAPSLTRSNCPKSVVAGQDLQSVTGNCARTKKSSNNGLISYLCDDSWFATTDYICQKEKNGRCIKFVVVV